MTMFRNIYPLGLGTNRFPALNINDEAGLACSVQLVLHALDSGVNYIDVAPGYSRGTAYQVLRHAFNQTSKPYHVTLKSRLDTDKTADAVRRQAEFSLKAMGINKASYAVSWSIFNYNEFEHIIKKGGPYEGMQKLKDEGIVNYICFSTHAPVPDIIRILKSGAYEGMTISYSILNSIHMQEVLDTAIQYNIGIVSMNPLGGGVIPQNREYFNFVCGEGEKNTVQANLRYISAHSAVKVVVAGPSSIEEFNENLSAFTEKNLETSFKRIRRVNLSLKNICNFCTGCNYCVTDCPQSIPISSYMQSLNALLFKPVIAYNRIEPELLKNIQLFKKLFMDFNIIPETLNNPCIKCGLCESRCTQKLDIINSLDDMFERIKKCNFSQESHKNILDKLLNNQGYKKVGIYPSGGYFAWVKEKYRLFFGEPEFEWILFNTDPAVWGTMQNKHSIYSPQRINELQPNVILICNYIYSDEIYNSIINYEKDGIRILKLHDTNSVPWLF